MMHRRIIFVVAVLGIMALVNIPPVFSQEKVKDWDVVDLNTMNCRDFLKTSGRDRDLVVAFYHGVVSGMKQEMSVNVPVLSEVTDKVVDQCIDNPKDILLKVFQENRK